MSTRFFASVRRNQKQWMVVVTVLSMVSFLFLDDFGRGKGPMSAFGGGLMIGCLCAAGMCIIGYPRQKTVEFGLGGLAVGFVAGFVGFGAVGANKPLARTAVGNLTRHDFERLAHNRQKVNQFIFAVARKTQNQQAQGFGGIDDPSMVTFQMLLADAKKMGIHVSDERVNEFLKQLTLGRLSQQDFRDCLRDARVGEGELFEILKQELAAQLYIELTKPPAYSPPIPPGLQQYIQQSPESMTYMQQTPYQLWTTYQKLTVKQSLQAFAIPVQEFTSKVGEPSAVELATFFEKFKTQPWTSESEPGFLQPQRVQLAYLSADYEKFEKGADPTEQDISEYYEKNKERYRAPLAKESTAPQLPDGEGDQEKKSDEDKKVPPASTTQETKPVDGEAKTEPKPEVEKAPKPDDKGADDPKSKCGDEPTETPAKSETQAAGNSEKLKQDPAGDSKGESKPAGDSGVPNLSSSPEALPAPKFRELNDELKSQIRDEILRERAFTRMTAELDKAREFMDSLGLDYDSTTGADKKKEKAKSIAEQLQKYAQDHKLDYKETAELSYDEMTSDPIGLAYEAKGRSPVMNEVFMQGARGEPRISLYSPRRADLKSETGSFAYWKIAETPAKVASLEDEAVRAKVLSAWKFDQARSVAEKRAADLVKKAKAEGNDLPAALSGESVTGDKNDPALTLIPTDPFTWLSINQSVPGNRQDPAISRIPLIDKVYNKFMKTVFEDLGDGEIGVASDEPRSVFYVVKVLNRETAQNDDGGVAKQERQKNFMKEEFSSKFFPLMKTPYESLARYPQQQIDYAWRKNFEQSHHVVWEEDVQAAKSRK